MTPLARRAAVAAASLLVAATPASAAFAWGATGHRLIGRLGVATLPDDLPAFLRSPEAVEAVGELAREPDRWKSSGLEHDSDRNPAHYVDIGDDGKIVGGPALAALPATRSDYETALHAAGTDSYHIGYLPYSIVDGWQQVTKDLAYWRVLTVAIPRERDPERKAWLQRDLARREALTLRDLGVWAHYVGDASQPMHVSVHHDGWGAFPNPNGYTAEKVHVPFESAFVRANIDQATVRAAMSPPSPCDAAIEACVSRYLSATLASVEPFYALQKAGAFPGVGAPVAGGDLARGKAFTAERIAAGADELRDLTITAWAASAHATVGYPQLTVDQVVKDGVDPYDALFGED